MQIPLFTLALAALAVAAPKEFGVGFTVGLAKDAPQLAGYLNTNDSAPSNNALYGNPINETSGSMNFFNGTGNSNLALIADQRWSRNPNLQGLFGAKVKNFGGSYGKVDFVTFVYNYQDFNWSVKKGVISHKLYSKNNAFFACNSTLFDDTTLFYVLSFGTYNKDNTPPAGCVATRVFQIPM